MGEEGEARTPDGIMLYEGSLLAGVVGGGRRRYVVVGVSIWCCFNMYWQVSGRAGPLGTGRAEGAMAIIAAFYSNGAMCFLGEMFCAIASSSLGILLLCCQAIDVHRRLLASGPTGPAPFSDSSGAGRSGSRPAEVCISMKTCRGDGKSQRQDRDRPNQHRSKLVACLCLRLACAVRTECVDND